MSAQDAKHCPVCGDFPNHLVVLTGQGQHPPNDRSRFEELATLNVKESGSWLTDRLLIRCPHCRCLFDWQDEPQYMGCGNLDEERFTRFPMRESKVAGDFFDGTLANPNDIFDALSKDFLWLVLDACVAEYVQRDVRLRTIQAVVPGVVKHMIHGDANLLEVLEKFVAHWPEGAAGVIAAFEDIDEVPDRARDLIKTCERTVRRLRRKKNRKNSEG